MSGTVYCLGEQLEELEDGNYEWLVYNYEYEGYGGGGDGVMLKNGNLYYMNFSHCSCYGPTDDGWEKIGSAQFLDGCVTSSPCDCADVDAKVRELLTSVN
jgi:hypothetical protein